MAVVFQDPHSGEETKDSRNRLLGGFFIYEICLCSIDRKGIGIPYLPVIIQSCSINGPGFSYDYIGKAEKPGQAGVLLSGIHHTDMRNKVSGHVETCELDTVIIILHLFKYSCCDPLGSFSQIIPRKHPVYICIIHRPEPFSDIHSMMIYGRYHQNSLILGNFSRCLQLFQLSHNLGADIKLLDFISSYASHYTGRFLFLSKCIAGYLQIFPVWRTKGINLCFSHALPPPSILPSREPL